MILERQTAWGGGIALYMFLAGTGAGIYIDSFMMRVAMNQRWPDEAVMALGPLLVIFGMLCLLLHAGSPLRSYRLIGGVPKSWISRGGLMQTLFIAFGLAYALPVFWVRGWTGSIAGVSIGFVALILAVATALYHGIALCESKAIPLWSSSIMPLLSFFTSLCTGLGLLLVAVSAYGGAGVAGGMKTVGVFGIAFTILELIGIWSLASARPTLVYVESVRSVKTLLVTSAAFFFTGAILVGLGVAAAPRSMLVFFVSGALLLAGGYMIRYAVLKGGHYLPLRIQVTTSI